MDRIESLERANRRWRFLCLSALMALSVVLFVAGYAFSQIPQQAQAPQVQFPIDPTPSPLAYTNFCQVNVTPEELILDLGLNTQMTPEAKNPVRMSNRVVMSFYTAKRLSIALNQVIQQHEAAYGKLELDYQKRAKAAAGGK